MDEGHVVLVRIQPTRDQTRIANGSSFMFFRDWTNKFFTSLLTLLLCSYDASFRLLASIYKLTDREIFSGG